MGKSILGMLWDKISGRKSSSIATAREATGTTGRTGTAGTTGRTGTTGTTGTKGATGIPEATATSVTTTETKAAPTPTPAREAVANVQPLLEPAESINRVDQLRADIAANAAFFHVFETGEAATTPAGMICSSHADVASETGYIRLANGKPGAASRGATDGYSIRLPDIIEAAASGKHIAVSIIARAAAGNDTSRFALAYSTNEVGNSGWRWFKAGVAWSVHTMEYDVPIMRKGNSDFVGILVEDEAHPATEFYYLAITIS
ncbi:hypothetical protein SAMN05216419_101226 [Nitrosomonas cryotolerans]|uniref:Uncharacterized protein n=1 Tax=Nitrosomonas cryotolerans ATCC 49181 TaxID=1131553 RepID=A0A1N6JFK9_9PROT|nr:hypothetical protein [Nitrosomonas cryotolerans]SFP67066.1 hypothetical protein SAMN05216419_101226 [Nitrosomonas cryotolerans]SIO43132.1 hypothetical protein SAMN02743940_2578 [Nitrosomonas cryotolerans ATCC 49181]